MSTLSYLPPRQRSRDATDCLPKKAVRPSPITPTSSRSVPLTRTPKSKSPSKANVAEVPMTKLRLIACFVHTHRDECTQVWESGTVVQSKRQLLTAAGRPTDTAKGLLDNTGYTDAHLAACPRPAGESVWMCRPCWSKFEKWASDNALHRWNVDAANVKVRRERSSVISSAVCRRVLPAVFGAAVTNLPSRPSAPTAFCS